MLQLNVLGGLQLLVDGRPADGRVAQRRRVALLTLVGLEDHGITRDRLASYLWPEANGDRSRHALAQLLYVLRRDLNADGILAGQDILRLDRGVLAIDALEFLDARSRGDDDTAVALYRGHLLDGLHLGESAELEHWVEAQRQRFAIALAAAADSVIQRARTSRDFGRAAAVARRWAGLSPYDSRAAARLIDVLVDADELTAAMTFAEQHDTFIREQIGHAPDRTFGESVRRLRARLEEAGQRASTAVRVSTEAVVDRPTLAPSPAARPRRVRWLAAALALIVIVATGVAASARALRRQSAAPNRVAVLPFDVRAPGELRFLDLGLIDLLSASLEGSSVLRPADPQYVVHAIDHDGPQTAASPERSAALAAKLNAPLFVRGSLVEAGTGGGVRLTAALYRTDAPRTAIAHASADGRAEDLFALVDHVALALTAERLGGLAARFEGLADRSAASLAAIRAYVDGEAAFRLGRYRDAVEAFERATQEDSSFALAYYRLAIAYDWAGYSRVARTRAIEAAERHGTHLPPHERALLDVVQLTIRGSLVRAHEQCKQIIAQYPHDVAAWYQLGEIEFHYYPWLGHSFVEARPAFEEVANLAPDDPGAPLHLARIAAFEGRRPAFDSLMRVHDSLSAGSSDPETALLEATVRGDAAVSDGLVQSLMYMGIDTVAGAAWRVAQYASNASVAERVARGLVRPARTAGERTAGYELLAFVGAMRRSWPGVRAAIEEIRRLDPARAEVLGASLAVLPSLDVPSRTLERVRADLDPATHTMDFRDIPLFGGGRELGSIRVYWMGELSARLRDRAGVTGSLAYLERSETRGVWNGWLRRAIVSLRADSLELADRRVEAYALLRVEEDSAIVHGDYLEPEARAHIARLAALTRDRSRAVRWYASFSGGFWTDLVYAPEAELALRDFALADRDSVGVREHDRRLRAMTMR